MKSPLHATVNFLYEVGHLARTPRSGFQLLGSGDQSVAEHINRVIYIGYVLATLEKDVDLAKVLQICMFHDLAETRTSDPNYLHQKYLDRHEDRAIHDLTSTLDFGQRILSIIEEYEERQTRESIIAKDADNLEWILSLKEQMDIGNARAKDWLDHAVKRLKTETAQQIAAELLQTSSDEWWFGDKDDDWWINRHKQP